MPKQRTHQNNEDKQRSKQKYDQTDDYQLGQQNKNVHTLNDLPVQQSQSEDDDILQKIDNLLLQNQNDYIDNSGEQQNKKVSKKQMLLNFKINQLQKMIQNLNQANKKMMFRLQEYEEKEQRQRQRQNGSRKGSSNNQSNSNILNSSTQSNPPFNDQLTEMQGQFSQIQLLIQEYKEQLSKSQKRWNTLKEQKDQQIESLKKQLISLAENNQILENQLGKKQQEIQILRSKNEQLLIQIQNIQIQFQQRTQYQSNSQRFYQSNQKKYYETPNKRFEQLDDYRFNQKIQKQMQNMIKKLLKQLSNQRKINNRMSFQIKRLNNQLIELQKKIKMKNDNIYQLEMKIIHLQKNNNGIRSPGKYATYSNHGNHAPLTPTQNKNQSKKYTNQRYENQYRGTSPGNRKYQQRQILMKQYDHAGYAQNSQEQSDNYEENSYQDQVINSIPVRSNKSPTINRPVQTSNVANIKNQIMYQNGQGQKNAEMNFFKLRRKDDKITKKGQNMPVPQNNKSANNSSRQFISFTLMQLQEGKMKITIKQKIIIISRLIETYCRKIKSKNYYNLIAEQIQIHNFHQKHPNLIRIRIIDPHSNNSKTDISSTTQQETEQSLMYNMAFIVETLVREVQTLDRQDLQVDLNLSEIIEEILVKSQQDKISYFQELSRSLEASVIGIQ